MPSKEPTAAEVEQRTMTLSLPIDDATLAAIAAAEPTVEKDYVEPAPADAQVPGSWMDAIVNATVLGETPPPARTAVEREIRDKLIAQTEDLLEAGKPIGVPPEFVGGA